MSTVVIRHKVQDYSAWKPYFDAHGATRGANGSMGGRLYRNNADLNEVLVVLDWDNLDRARLFAQSDDLRETMAEAGVTDHPDIWFLEETDLAVV